MAVWQYTFVVLTRAGFEALHGINNASTASLELGIEPYWLIDETDKSFFKKIGSILQKEKSWSDEIDQYGNLESNCFEVYFDISNNRVQSVSFRIDFRTNYEEVLGSIIEFCVLNGLIIIDENADVVSLNLESAKYLIQTAPQVGAYNKLSR